MPIKNCDIAWPRQNASIGVYKIIITFFETFYDGTFYRLLGSPSQTLSSMF